jgi:hypothetical protein
LAFGGQSIDFCGRRVAVKSVPWDLNVVSLN